MDCANKKIKNSQSSGVSCNAPNKLWRITLDTNPEDCNFHCIMCEEHSEYSHFKEQLYQKTGCRRRRMPVEWLDRIMADAAAIGVTDVIPSTMGEPLLYQGIDEFFDAAERHGLKINLTTNGSFPGKPIEKWAKIIIPMTRDVKISLNGARKETSEAIMRGSDFDAQICHIKVLLDERNRHFNKTGWYCSITLQLTFMQNNMGELADIVKLACELGIDRIKGHHLWTHFDEIKDLSMKASLESIAQWNEYVREARAAQEKWAKTLPNGERLRLENIEPLAGDRGENVPEEYECPFLGRELWISATGRISPCCCPDDKRRTLGDFGHFPETGISDVLNSSEYRNLLADYKTREVCRTCNMRR